MEKIGPWKRTSTKICYDRPPYMTIYEDEVIQPDGKKGIYSRIASNWAVHILPVDEEGNCYLVSEFKYGVGGLSIQTIGGYIEKNETPQNAAKRELSEEGGIDASELISLGFVHPNPSSSDNRIYYFLAKNLELTKASPESTEQIELVKLKLEDAVSKVVEGEITYAASGLLILKAEKYLNKK